MNLKHSFLFIFLIILAVSCDKKRVFDDYQSVNSGWKKNSPATFLIEKLDPKKDYNLFVNIRANDDYKYNNLFLIVSLEQPDGLTKTDTLEYQMAQDDGTMLGDGFSDIKESKLVYKERFKFKYPENNKVRIRHAIRQSGKVSGDEILEGITDIGFRIESTEK
jgi:gliding motility-associated lipoprotein GldH